MQFPVIDSAHASLQKCQYVGDGIRDAAKWALIPIDAGSEGVTIKLELAPDGLARRRDPCN